MAVVVVVVAVVVFNLRVLFVCWFGRWSVGSFVWRATVVVVGQGVPRVGS